MVRHHKPKQRNENSVIGIQNEKYDDITQYFQKLKPPPPPENDNSWELQYCRWWGWNWVKKKEEPRFPLAQQEECKKNQAQQSKAENKKIIARPEHKHRHDHEKKVKKKHFKQLCNCLCFKKPKSMDNSLQELYKTPSNSVVLHETYMCGYTEKHGDSISHLEMRRNVSRTGKRGVCKCNFQKNVSQDDTFEEEISSSYQEEDDDTPGQYRSTEESSEYINVKCCCAGEKIAESTIKRIDFQTQTSYKTLDKAVEQNIEPTLVCLCKVCQKAAKSKKKKKRLHIICHCCCCKCNNLHGIENTSKDNNEKQRKLYQEENDQNQRFCPTKGRCTENYRVEKSGNTPYGIKEKLLIDNAKFLETMRPWDRIFHGNKAFSKFGTPSKKYSWLHSTQSDILDKCYSLKIDEEFSSPVSGKKYNLAPIKFDYCDEMTTSTLPDPIEVEEDIEYLNHLENQIKMDFKSRVMLDTICDAILFKANKNDARDKSSFFMDEYTFPVEPHGRDDNFLREYLHGDDIPPPLENSSPMQEVEFTSPESNPQTRHRRIVQQVEDIVRNLLSNDDVRSSDKNRQIDKKEINVPFQNGNDSKVNVEPDSIRNLNKRVASPLLSEQQKKLKYELSSTDSLVKTVDNLIAKIDEITVKGKVNVEKIQNVFNLDSPITSDGKGNWNENYMECSKRANPSEIFHKIDQIIKCSNDNNDKIENVMHNTCPKIHRSFCDYISKLDESHATTFANEEKEVQNEVGTVASQEQVNAFEEPPKNVPEFDCNMTAISEENETDDTNLVNIKKKRFSRSMIPVRGKNL